MAEGRLRRIAGAAVRGMGAYYLVWPVDDGGHPPRVAFQAWLDGACDVLR
jgi:hypothetical protein